MDKISPFTDKKNVFAIVGASNNKKKYGNIIFLDLLRAGYAIYPINPKESLIEGETCYKSLTEISKEKNIDIVIIVVPPQITEKVLVECKALKINKVWMQPGSESEKAIKYCEDNKIKLVHDMCIIMEKRRR